MTARATTACGTGGRGRFAPSTTGRAHPGTLLAALLAWLDARSREGEVLLRLEDLDRERTKAGFVEALVEDLAWFGLDWDGVARQSASRQRHEAVLASLAAEGRVYACDCSRARLRAAGVFAPDGSAVYPGTCRARVVSRIDDAPAETALRLVLAPDPIRFRDESGTWIEGDASALFGDPILRRRDGASAYHLASVVDDADAGVDRVVRGRDLLPSTLLQVALQRVLDFETPSYRHHALFLERRGDKFSKLHGAVDATALRAFYDAEGLCGVLSSAIGLVPPGTRCRPIDLVSGFDWARVSLADVALDWDPERGIRRVEAATNGSREDRGTSGRGAPRVEREAR